MTIEAKVVAHSRADGAPDLITMQVKYPRMVHSEFMTHRVFSRNASSSRAIPIERMIRDVEEDPAMPAAWGSNKPGMQAGVELPPHIAEAARETWLLACEEAVDRARQLAEFGAHKQIVNRLLEPFAHITVVVTATDFDNFFDLRCHPDADPTMRAVAEAMRDAIAGSTPAPFDSGWHLPYISQADWDYFPDVMSCDEVWPLLAMISAARCARVSYLNHDGTSPNIDKDLALAKRLLDSKHMSPFEHQAQAQTDRSAVSIWPPEPVIKPSNLRGWTQHRKIIEVAA